MIINLSEIPQEGRSYFCTEKTGEFNDVLADLIGERPYHIEFFIQPVGNIYQMSGSIDSKIELSCSRCLCEFPLPIHEQIKELLIPSSKEMPRTGRETKVNHTSELETNGPSTTILDSSKFDASKLIRDLVSLGQPTYSLCQESCQGLCQHCGSNLNEQTCSCDQVHKEKSSPFAILNELKFN